MPSYQAHTGGLCLGLPLANQRLLYSVQEFLNGYGRDLPTTWEVVKVDEAFACFCADVHELAQHTPHDANTAASYQAFIVETLEQFEQFCRSGYRIELWPHKGQPYACSQEMRADVASGSHLFV